MAPNEVHDEGLRPGVLVRVTSGMCAGMVGPVMSEDEARRQRQGEMPEVVGNPVWVRLTIFGRPVPVPFGAECLVLL